MRKSGWMLRVYIALANFHPNASSNCQHIVFPNDFPPDKDVLAWYRYWGWWPPPQRMIIFLELIAPLQLVCSTKSACNRVSRPFKAWKRRSILLRHFILQPCCFMSQLYIDLILWPKASLMGKRRWREERSFFVCFSYHTFHQPQCLEGRSKIDLKTFKTWGKCGPIVFDFSQHDNIWLLNMHH